MLYYTTEIIIPMGEQKTIFSAQRIVLRIEDEAAGPFLSMEGKDDEGDNPHAFYLCTEKDINEFSAICKKMLADANKTWKEGGME